MPEIFGACVLELMEEQQDWQQTAAVAERTRNEFGGRSTNLDRPPPEIAERARKVEADHNRPSCCTGLPIIVDAQLVERQSEGIEQVEHRLLDGLGEA